MRCYCTGNKYERFLLNSLSFWKKLRITSNTWPQKMLYHGSTQLIIKSIIWCLKVSKLMRSGVVYLLKCRCCSASYVGQTTRHLHTRISKHLGVSPITWKPSSSPVMLRKKQLVAEGEVITSLYSLSRRRSEYRLVITEPEATNCFSINFQVFTKIMKTTIKIHFRKNICKNSLCLFSLQNSLFT